MKEIWKDIKGYEGFYKASNLGRIKRLSRKFTMKNGRRRKINTIIICQHIHSNGYLMARLYNPSKLITVHRIILSTFDDNKYHKPTINHKNGNKTDNRLSNLEWCTYKENMIHAVKTGLFNIPRGYGNHASKTIYQFDKKGNLIKEYGSVNEASRITGLQCSELTRCANGKRNTKTVGGFIWKYTKD